MGGIGGIGGRKEKGGSDVIIFKLFLKKKLTSTLITCIKFNGTTSDPAFAFETLFHSKPCVHMYTYVYM